MSVEEISKEERKLIAMQIARRAKWRQEFLKQRSDPCKHSKESGFVFDESIQRFLSMKTSQLDHFQVNISTITFGVCAIIIPMSIYGYAVWKMRQEWLKEIGNGNIKYKDRIFKFK